MPSSTPALSRYSDRLGFRVGVFQVLAVIHAHLGVDIGVVRLFEARQRGELREHFQGVRRAVRLGQRAVEQQLVVDLDLVADTQAVRHLHDVDTVDEGFVVLVVAETVPFRFVGVRQQNTGERIAPSPSVLL